jgi:hypothetical protein
LNKQQNYEKKHECPIKDPALIAKGAPVTPHQVDENDKFVRAQSVVKDQTSKNKIAHNDGNQPAILAIVNKSKL